MNIDKKLQEYISDRISKGYMLRPTTDQWYPNFPNDMVLVSPVLELSNGTYRVCVWGADDDGMEIDLPTKMQAIEILQKLPPVITKKDLKQLGFWRA